MKVFDKTLKQGHYLRIHFGTQKRGRAKVKIGHLFQLRYFLQTSDAGI